MILIEEKSGRSAQLLVIRQTDHAFLAGFLAREWGNERFTKPQPNAAFCLAAAEHDNGWAEWELRPQLDGKTGLPFTFMSIPTAEHMAIYKKGIERLVRADHYAGLLASMHASVLYDRGRATLPGYSAKYVKSDEVQLVNEFVQQLRLQQLRLKVDLRANPATAPFVEDSQLKANLKRLEALDRLSLHFCTNSQLDATVDEVPVNDAGEETELYLHPEGAEVIALTPYPFRRDSLEFSIMARRVPKKVYGGVAEFQATLAAARYFPVQFTIRARRENAFSQGAR